MNTPLSDERNSNRLLNAVFLILFLYFSQIALHLPDIAGQGLIVLYLCIGAAAMFSSFFIKRRPFFLTAAAIFVVFISTIWIFSEKEVSSLHLGRISASIILKNSLAVSLSLFTGFIAGRRSSGTERQEAWLTCLLALTCLIQFFSVFIVFKEGQEGNAFFVNNSAYCFITLLPYIYLISSYRRGLSAALIIFAFLFLALCHKRGAMLCFFIATAYWTVTYLRTSPDKLKAGAICMMLMTVAAIAVMIQIELDPAAYIRLLQTLEGYSSGRDVIYSRILESFAYETHDSILLFGNGLSQSIEITGNYAHSDWLELLADAGVAGVGIYSLFFLSYLFYMARNRTRIQRDDLLTMNLIMLLLFIKSIYSMGFLAIFNSFDLLLLGFLTGRNNSARLRN